MRRSVQVLVVAAVLAATSPGAAALAIPQPPPGPGFAAAIFRATHNSYSGGEKRSIRYQLDQGVRFLEYDIHDNGFRSRQDYALGHDEPGNQVDHSGNPASDNLREWLETVARWSSGHPNHAPLTIALDLKDNLTDNPGFADGNLAALNAELTSVFGSKLLQAKDVSGTLPSIDKLRGRILAVFSGDELTRKRYRSDGGSSPAVAVNKRGQVVEVHDSGSGVLWYWTGQLGADGRVTWLRHGRYDNGITPAVALGDDGTIVEVHQSQRHPTLWSHVGKLGADGDINWSGSVEYDHGVQPTVRFTNSGTVQEIHKSDSHEQNWTWNGAVGTNTVRWSGNAKTSSARHNKAESGQVRVWTGADGSSPTDTVRYSTGKVSGERIRYQQVAFVECQKGNGPELEQGALFFAAKATEKGWIADQRAKGRIVRGWDYDSKDLKTAPLVSQPATNHPYKDWYTQLTSGAVL